ncbi:uncharacterized protein LOC134687531 [Mytilus trossulus]|uniref:uncharacterized protein LOC134687531 n=1 Tax=Mytilus trossulus TaxID=6551 RepID=UPI003004EBBB
MEPRFTRQTVKEKSSGNVQLNDHNKNMRKKKAKSLAKKSEKNVSNASLQSSIVSALPSRKRKFDQRIKEPKPKVAKASMSSTKIKVAKASMSSTKIKVAKTSLSSTKIKVAKASLSSTKINVAKASLSSTKIKVAKASLSSTKIKVAKASLSSTKIKVAKASLSSTKIKVAKASLSSTKIKVAKASLSSTKTKVDKASLSSTKTKVAKASLSSTKIKVAKASLSSTKIKVAKASLSSTKIKVAKASLSSTKTKVDKASVPSTKTKVAKAAVPSTTTTAKKNKRNSKDSSVPRTGKRGRGSQSSLQHHRTRKAEEINSKDTKSDSIKLKKNISEKVKRQHLKVTSLTSNRMTKRKRSKALDLKSETQTEKRNLKKKKLLITKPPNKSRRQRLPSKEYQIDKIKENTKKTSFIRPYLSFDTNLPYLVSNICCVDQNTLWIGRMAYGTILKVTHSSSKTLTIVKELEQCDFYDFCYDRNEDQILYTDRINNSIMSISSNYKLTKFKCVEPLKPTCITISLDDFIFLGLVDEYSYRKSPKREIVKMAKNGTVVMRIPSIHYNIVRFSMSHRIAIHPNNDIIIATNDMNGEVLLSFDPEGKSKFAKTVTNLNPGIRFHVSGLTISKAGDIVVCNDANEEIYIYDVKGELLETITSQSIGITDRPWSLAFDSSDHLLIGTLAHEPKVPTICFADYLYR